MLINSCSVSKKVEKTIVNKWEIVSVEDNKNTNADKQKLFNDLLGESHIIFKENYSYELKIFGKTFEDNWSVSEDGKKILSSSEDSYFLIKQMDVTSMTLKSIKGDKELTIKLKKI